MQNDARSPMTIASSEEPFAEQDRHRGRKGANDRTLSIVTIMFRARDEQGVWTTEWY
jgi:hypothetical protein